jgi:hypothetical protein
MAIVLKQYELAYYPVHKCGNTSVKLMIFNSENVVRFGDIVLRGEKIGQAFVHDMYPSFWPSFAQLDDAQASYFKFAVVRDPVSRIFAAYKNKVVARKHQMRRPGRKIMEDRQVPFEPTFSEFVQHLDVYRETHSQIGTHTVPLNKFLGDDPDYFDRIYAMAEIPEIADMLSERCGHKIDVPVANASSQDGVTVDAPTDSDVAMIKDRFASDYAIFGAYF